MSQKDEINALLAEARHADEVVIDYTNWRGERRLRRVRPIGMKFCSTPHHPKTQWIMFAVDEGDHTQPIKAFAVELIHSFH